MKILVMGGTRFVGKSLVRKLLNQNYDIDIFTRGNNSNPDNTNLIKGDRNDIECILKLKNKKLVKDLSTKYPKRIIVGIDAKEGKVSTRGWLEQSDVLATDLVKEFSSFKIASFIVTDINTDGTLEGTNEVFIKKIIEITDIPVIASGGVGSISDLLSLTKFEDSGLYGVIVGKALYENKFTISEASNILSTERINDIPINKDYYAWKPSKYL